MSDKSMAETASHASKELKAHAGPRGNAVRSDCWVEVIIKDQEGINIELSSRVKSLYGPSIENTIRHTLSDLKVHHATVRIEDAGALPFVIAARVEAAVKRAIPQLQEESLPPMKDFCTYPSQKQRFRRSRLYLPGNEPKFMLNAGLHKPDGIILDLEDSVSQQEKDAARILVRNALRQLDFFGAERMVRINPLPEGEKDLRAVVPHNVHLILIPKCESATQVLHVAEMIAQIKGEDASDDSIFLMPIIETAKGVFEAYHIATAHPAVVALTIGLEDYTADMGAQRTPQGRESFWARSVIVNAARAAGIQPIDTVYSNVADSEGLRESVLEAKSLGFEGKGCIHPRQIAVVHQGFAPTEGELEKAKAIVQAYEEAQKQGRAVVSLGRKMIDPPVVKRALRMVNYLKKK